MTNRSLAEWLGLLESRHPSEIELGLERVDTVWKRFQSAQSSVGFVSQVITVAGTNGKGSCIASMQAVLLAHGYSVGSFTSPHFLVYNERICLNGQPVDDACIVAAFELIESLREDISLTYFEFNTLAALIIFTQKSPQIVLLEVGLGGRLDAANIIDSDIAVLTSVDLDHQQWLGNTRTKIAQEKLGIARVGKPLIIGESNYPDNFAQLVESTKADALWIGKDFDYQLQSQQFTVSLCSADNQPISVGMLANHGPLAVNKTIALQALTSLGCPLDAQICRDALQNIPIVGRQQQVEYQSVPIILDVAHNPAAALKLAENLTNKSGKTFAVASVLEDKDWQSMVASLQSQIDYWFIAELAGISRAAKGQSLLKLLYNTGCEGMLCESVETAFKSAVSKAEKTDNVLVFGSFHTVARVLEFISMEVESE
jgi:dihydrofolate synthase/folylpolyglutamate synthase